MEIEELNEPGTNGFCKNGGGTGGCGAKWTRLAKPMWGCGKGSGSDDALSSGGWWVLDGTKSGCLFDDCRHHSMRGPADWSKQMCSCCCVDSWTLGIGICSDLGFLLYFTNSKNVIGLDCWVSTWALNMLYNA